MNDPLGWLGVIQQLRGPYLSNLSPTFIEWTEMVILHKIYPLSGDPTWNFQWPSTTSSCPRSYCMTPNWMMIIAQLCSKIIVGSLQILFFFQSKTHWEFAFLLIKILSNVYNLYYHHFRVQIIRNCHELSNSSFFIYHFVVFWQISYLMQRGL